MNRIHRIKQQGAYVLITVVVTLFIVAAIALLLNRESAIGVNSAGREAQGDQAAYVAEAGYRHALWQTNNSNCTGYPNPLTANFGTHSYKVNVTPSSGSPVSFTSTSALIDGTSRSLSRNNVKIYEAPTTVTLQLGTDPGKDAMIDSFYPIRNHGINYAAVRGDPSWTQHELVQFDISSLPPGVEIVSARLEFYQTGAGSLTSDSAVTAHRITQDWLEGTKAGGGAADGATWETYDGSADWTSVGGDFDPTSVTSTAVTAGNKWTGWEIASLVSSWLAGSVPNQGVLLKTNGNFYVNFEPTEASSAALRPKLTITYACECGGSCATPPVTASGTYRDEFNSRTCNAAVDYIGSNGTLDWSTESWSEFGDDGAPCMMAIQVVNDATVPETGSYRVQLKGMGKGIQRRMDLSGFSEAHLSFDYRRVITSSMAGVIVDVSSDNGSSWNNAGQINSIATDSAYLSESIDISAYMSDKTIIRFSASALGMGQLVYLDNIMVGDAVAPASCNANYAADNEVSNWDSSALGSFIDLTYIPAGLVVNGVTIPAGGGWALVSNSNNDIVIVDMTGNLLTTLSVPVNTIPFFNSIDFVSTGIHAPAFFLSSADATSGELTIQPANGTAAQHLGHTEKTVGATFIDDGDYKNYFLANSLVNAYIYDDSGSLVGTFTKPADISLMGPMIHLPGSNLFTIQDRTPDKAVIAELSGSLPNPTLTTVNSFDVIQFGVTNFTKGAGLDNENCHYALILQSGLIKLVNKGSAGPGSTLTLNASSDTYLKGGSSSNYGSNGEFRLGRDNGGPSLYGLLKFDVSAITPGTTITSAKLRINQYDSNKSGTVDIGAFRIDQDWTESGANWSTANGSTAWSGGAGGTYSSPAISTTNVNLKTYGWYEWDVTALVQEWVDNVSPNHGIELVYVSINAGRWSIFASKEHADSSIRPQLVIDY